MLEYQTPCIICLIVCDHLHLSTLLGQREENIEAQGEMDRHSSHSTNIQWHSHEPIKANKTILHPWPALWYFPLTKMSAHSDAMSRDKLTLSESGHICNLHRVHRGCDQTERMHPWAQMIQHPRCLCLQMTALIMGSCSSSFRIRANIQRLSLFLELQRGNMSLLGEFCALVETSGIALNRCCFACLVYVFLRWQWLSLWQQGTSNKTLVVHCTNIHNRRQLAWQSLKSSTWNNNTGQYFKSKIISNMILGGISDLPALQ